MEHITIGKNQYHNWVIIEEADGDDLWFHVDSMPSGHVILASEAPKSLMKMCARICKERSKAPSNRKVRIVYTKVSNIFLGKHPGEVRIKNASSCKFLTV
jgi:predicted ribosome quality control (RQC) complex YloA/Tae2 family protein